MKRHRKSIVLPIIATLAVIGIFWFFIPKKVNPYPRQTMVLVGSPMTILSLNEKDRSLTLVTIPSDMTADGTHGYGTYSFDAFWKLGEIDKKDGTVLSESMSEALGIPVAWYIGPKTGLFASTTDALTRIKQVFSVKSIGAYVSAAYRTNIPFAAFLHYVWLLQVIKPERIDTYDFTHNPSLIADDVVIADGSHQFMVNLVRLDARLAHVFEDEQIRRETITTAIFNTTDMSSLGTRVARLLGNIGVSVVSVGNDTPEVDTCRVSGTQTSLKSVSAKLIESVLGCIGRETPESNPADLTVRIGASYAKRFLPN